MHNTASTQKNKLVSLPATIIASAGAILSIETTSAPSQKRAVHQQHHEKIGRHRHRGKEEEKAHRHIT
jgi:hypothetical protein